MIPISRLKEPPVLEKNKEKWLTSFLEKREKTPGIRPPSSQYGHKEVRDTLRAMSFHKCFYCERKISETEDEVDHYIEVAERPEKAFDWKNLYLCCSKCNKKFPNETIPVSECLDPCDLSENPAEHLTFEDEFITSKMNSPKAIKTIQKYKLDRGELTYLRSVDRKVSFRSAKIFFRTG